MKTIPARNRPLRASRTKLGRRQRLRHVAGMAASVCSVCSVVGFIGDEVGAGNCPQISIVHKCPQIANANLRERCGKCCQCGSVARSNVAGCQCGAGWRDGARFYHGSGEMTRKIALGAIFLRARGGVTPPREGRLFWLCRLRKSASRMLHFGK